VISVEAGNIDLTVCNDVGQGRTLAESLEFTIVSLDTAYQQVARILRSELEDVGGVDPAP
jgi:hypothetical protein